MNARHPSEEHLALFSSGDMGGLERWRIGRHVADCADCTSTVAEYAAQRFTIADASAPADISWNKLAAEMRANIRLGLEAGECVSQASPAGGFFGARSLAACASLAVLLFAALWLERPTPRAGTTAPAAKAAASAGDQVVLEATGSGIQVTEGGQSLGLLHGRARDVDYFASGVAMRARYVDPDTGNVTINNVYGQ